MSTWGIIPAAGAGSRMVRRYASPTHRFAAVPATTTTQSLTI